MVCKSHLRWGIFLPNLGSLGLWVLRLFVMYAMDGQKQCLLPPSLQSGHNKLENILKLKGLKMTPPPGLKIYLRPRVTLTFDLLTPKVIGFMPCPVDHWCQLASKSADSFSKHCVDKFAKKTDRWTDRQTTIENNSTARQSGLVRNDNSSSSRMRFMSHNWSPTKQRLHPQSVAEISHHLVLSGDRIRQCETSSGSHHKDTDQCL